MGTRSRSQELKGEILSAYYPFIRDVLAIVCALLLYDVVKFLYKALIVFTFEREEFFEYLKELSNKD